MLQITWHSIAGDDQNIPVFQRASSHFGFMFQIHGADFGFIVTDDMDPDYVEARHFRLDLSRQQTWRRLNGDVGWLSDAQGHLLLRRYERLPIFRYDPASIIFRALLYWPSAVNGWYWSIRIDTASDESFWIAARQY